MTGPHRPLRQTGGAASSAALDDHRFVLAGASSSGLLSGSPAASGAEEREPDAPPAANRQCLDEDAEIVARIDGFLSRDPVHLDLNLNLLRLARRLHLPETRLSSTANCATGQNVSRYVNAWRIRHACKLIEAGSTVTDAMLDSGFNTKSNFHRIPVGHGGGAKRLAAQ